MEEDRSLRNAVLALLALTVLGFLLLPFSCVGLLLVGVSHLSSVSSDEPDLVQSLWVCPCEKEWEEPAPLDRIEYGGSMNKLPSKNQDNNIRSFRKETVR